MSAVAHPGTQKRTPMQGLFDDRDSNGPPTGPPSDHQSTWAAGDKNTKALSEALRQRLSTSKEEAGPQPRPGSPKAPADIKGATEFDTVVSCALSPQDMRKNLAHCEKDFGAACVHETEVNTSNRGPLMHQEKATGPDVLVSCSACTTRCVHTSICS